jgi:hypothetical protein
MTKKSLNRSAHQFSWVALWAAFLVSVAFTVSFSSVLRGTIDERRRKKKKTVSKEDKFFF